MSRVFWERRAVRTALQTYLESNGWDSLRYDEGWPDPAKAAVVTPPQIVVEVSLNNNLEFQLGRTLPEKIFVRAVQIDAYMESEDRVNTLLEEIAIFVDSVVINVNNADNTTIGTMLCYSSEDISMATFPPIITPEILRWRGALTAIYIVQYPNG